MATFTQRGPQHVAVATAPAVLALTFGCTLLANVALAAERGTSERDNETTAAKPPNILFIAVDDLRPELHPYDGKPFAIQAKTPNLDQLAATGLTFTRAYCNQAVCGASRLSLMSGLYPEFTGERDYHVTGWRERWSEVVTMNQHFVANGYTTVGLGKIYHGGAGAQVDASNWTEWIETGGERYADPESLKNTKVIRIRNGKRTKGPATEAAEVDDAVYLDGHRAAEGVQQLNRLSSTGKPFFLAVGFAKPHLPFNAPKKYWDLYQREDFAMPTNLGIPPGYPKWASNAGASELRNYSDIPQGPTNDFPQELNQRLIHGYHACVSYMDNCVGQLLSALDESGVADNTIVVFWGDHGWKLGDHTSWVKHTNFECDARVPLMIRHPGMAEARGVSKALVELIDLYPTLCELTGLDLPAHLQGRSLVPILQDPKARHRDYAYSTYPHMNTDTRQQVVGHSIRNERIRYTEWWEEGEDRIVARVATDLEADPGETTNLLPKEKTLGEQLSADLRQLVLAAREATGLEYRAGASVKSKPTTQPDTPLKPQNAQSSPLLKQLNLTDEQRPQFLAIQKAMSEKWAELKEIPAEERQAEQEAFYKARHAEIAELLTPEQLKIYRAHQQARKKQK